MSLHAPRERLRVAGQASEITGVTPAPPMAAPAGPARSPSPGDAGGGRKRLRSLSEPWVWSRASERLTHLHWGAQPTPAEPAINPDSETREPSLINQGSPTRRPRTGTSPQQEVSCAGSRVQLRYCLSSVLCPTTHPIHGKIVFHDMVLSAKKAGDRSHKRHAGWHAGLRAGVPGTPSGPVSLSGPFSSSCEMETPPPRPHALAGMWGGERRDTCELWA